MADSSASTEEPIQRKALRVLRIVHELHKCGFQELRILPGMAASGCYWRCEITPKSNLHLEHGSLATGPGPSARYSTGMNDRYFEWEDARFDNVQALARKFRERFPEIVEASRGRDWEYVGWYVEMLGFAERGNFPVAYADWYGDPPTYLAIDKDGVELPYPPPGSALG